VVPSRRGGAAVGWDLDSTVAAWAGPPQLVGDREADACVVGLGASGLAAVAALVERGLSVIGIDAGRVAAGAAGRNGGFLLGGPSLFLHDAIGRWGPCAVDLYTETLRELDRMHASLGEAVVRRTGSVRLAGLPGDPRSEEEAADRAREVDDCRQHAAALRRHGFSVEDYDGPWGTGLYLPDDAAMNPALRALAVARMIGDSAELHEATRATAVERGRVVTDTGTIRAGVVVVAVDGRLEAVLPQLAGRVRTTRLQMLATAPTVHRLDFPLYGRWGLDYVHQTLDGRLFVGGGRDRFADDEWTLDTEPTGQVQRYLEQLARRIAPGEPEVTHRWAASVGYTPDARPLCTLVDDGVVAVGGYNGTGNLVGPIAARAAVALAVDGTEPPPYLASGTDPQPKQQNR
jgi:gamma-glutamylputrescine oxidase